MRHLVDERMGRLVVERAERLADRWADERQAGRLVEQRVRGS